MSSDEEDAYDADGREESKEKVAQDRITSVHLALQVTLCPRGSFGSQPARLEAGFPSYSEAWS